MPINHEAFGDLGGVCTLQDDRKSVPGGKEPGDLSVYGDLFAFLAAYERGPAEQVKELVRECDVELADAEAGSDGDESGGEVDFSEADIGDATADGDVLRVTEQCVQQV